MQRYVSNTNFLSAVSHEGDFLWKQFRLFRFHILVESVIKKWSFHFWGYCNVLLSSFYIKAKFDLFGARKKRTGIRDERIGWGMIFYAVMVVVLGKRIGNSNTAFRLNGLASIWASWCELDWPLMEAGFEATKVWDVGGKNSDNRFSRHFHTRWCERLEIVDRVE